MDISRPLCASGSKKQIPIIQILAMPLDAMKRAAEMGAFLEA